jgi:hypothetical protein
VDGKAAYPLDIFLSKLLYYNTRFDFDFGVCVNFAVVGKSRQKFYLLKKFAEFITKHL